MNAQIEIKVKCKTCKGRGKIPKLDINEFVRENDDKIIITASTPSAKRIKNTELANWEYLECEDCKDIGNITKYIELDDLIEHIVNRLRFEFYFNSFNKYDT
jgi:hypothetical protein